MRGSEGGFYSPTSQSLLRTCDRMRRKVCWSLETNGGEELTMKEWSTGAKQPVSEVFVLDTDIETVISLDELIR